MVKITPSHDPNDFEIGLRHNLPQVQVIGLDGMMTEEAGKYGVWIAMKHAGKWCRILMSLAFW